MSMSPSEAGPAVLEAQGLFKSFGPVEVLSDVSLTVRPGEVHAIIGENGAGKSTLMKILAGNHQPTRGEIIIGGEPVHFTGPVDAENRGIVLVHLPDVPGPTMVGDVLGRTQLAILVLMDGWAELDEAMAAADVLRAGAPRTGYLLLED